MSRVQLEYRVNKIERYIVTRFTDNEGGCSVEERGQYASQEMANEVAYALCKLEHQGLGWEAGDERIKYPDNSGNSIPA